MKIDQLVSNDKFGLQWVKTNTEPCRHSSTGIRITTNQTSAYMFQGKKV